MNGIVKTLSLTVLATIMSFNAVNAKQLSNAEKQMMAENILQADSNSDGAINRSEFEILINLNAADNLGKASLIKRTNRYSMAFNRVDLNGDGLITESEIQKIAAQAK